MEGFNKLLALFAALFITIIVGFLIVRKYNLQAKYPIFGGGADQPTPTTVISGDSQTSEQIDSAQAIKDKFTQTKTTANKGVSNGNVKAIPETGVSTLFIPFSFGLLYSGLRLRKRS